MAKIPVLTDEQHDEIVTEVAMMLHASRDCLRNRKVDTSVVPFDARDGYYGEAFGIMRGLVVLGYGYFGPDCDGKDEIIHPLRGINVKKWFRQICDEVLREENFGGNNHCDHCVKRYGKDGSGRTRSTV